MSRIVWRRYRGLWVLLLGLLSLCVFFGAKRVICYDFSGIFTGSTEDEFLNSKGPDRSGHPRMELFEDDVESLGMFGEDPRMFGEDSRKSKNFDTGSDNFPQPDNINHR